MAPPWTNDSILQTYKFTNAYRASDRVSQFLIRSVIYDGSYSWRDTFLRVMLFKFFNRIDTWNLLLREFRRIDTESFDFERCDRVLSDAIERGTKIFSAAYIMPTKRCSSGRKHKVYLQLLQQMLQDRLPEAVRDLSSMREVFLRLKQYPLIGPFLAYQYATDLNYSHYLSLCEMEFVAAGPGAKDGIHKCFFESRGWDCEDIIRWVTTSQEEEFNRRGITFKRLGGRPLQLIDCQNLFCELSKYARMRHPWHRRVFEKN